MLLYRRLKHLLDRLPIKLSAKQLELVGYEGDEALFGGAAGGGKSIALLVWLLEGVHIPGYNAAIFRKYQSDTKDDESALLSRAGQIFPAFGAKLVGLRWLFPTRDGRTSSIVMEGIAHDTALLKTQGKEYHRLAFDELTHFTEQAFQFVVTTRMRSTNDIDIPLGVRSSANPGGPGHLWVKDRYITEDAIRLVRDIPTNEPTPFGMIFHKQHDGFETAYLPSRAYDNPNLDVERYIRQLSKNKNPVERARMMNGDWGITPEGLIKPYWFRYYRMRDKIVELLVSRVDDRGEVHHSEDEVIKEFNENECRRFMTIDTAGGMKDITAASKGKSLSWTVIGVWYHKRWNDGQALLLKYVWRDRVGFTDVCNQIRKLQLIWQCSSIRVEDKTMGPDLENVLRGQVPISLIPAGSVDKVSRATTALNLFEQGCIYFPKYENTWRHTYESELLGWQGLDDETNDQVDMTSYAAIESNGLYGGKITLAVDPRKEVIIGAGNKDPNSKPNQWVAGTVRW